MAIPMYLDKNSWIKEVVRLAKNYGYSDYEIRMFATEIEMSWYEGDSAEDCVSKVF